MLVFVSNLHTENNGILFLFECNQLTNVQISIKISQIKKKKKKTKLMSYERCYFSPNIWGKYCKKKILLLTMSKINFPLVAHYHK
jgi:hypothetical protein